MVLRPNRFKVFRAERALTQRDVATRAKIGLDKYWRLENGYYEPTEAERLAIAKAFDLPTADVFPEAVSK